MRKKLYNYYVTTNIKYALKVYQKKEPVFILSILKKGQSFNNIAFVELAKSDVCIEIAKENKKTIPVTKEFLVHHLWMERLIDCCSPNPY